MQLLIKTSDRDRFIIKGNVDWYKQVYVFRFMHFIRGSEFCLFVYVDKIAKMPAVAVQSLTEVEHNRYQIGIYCM